MKTNVRRLIEIELSCGTHKDVAERIEKAIIDLIHTEFAFERKWHRYTSRPLETRLTEPEEEYLNPGPEVA